MNPKLIVSAASKQQFINQSAIEIVCVGKSNVGKSTLINGIVNRKNLAYVGQRPGKTRLVNFYQIFDYVYLVDVPGYGYANRSFKEQENYANLMEAYFNNRANLKAMFIIVDIRRNVSDDDLMMLDLAKSLKIGCALVFSKTDKVSFMKQKEIINNAKNKYKIPVYSFSDLDKNSFVDIKNQFNQWINQ